MIDVFTLGEAMLRFSVPPGESLRGSGSFEVHVAGAEANVAVALGRLGRSVSWASLVADNQLGHRVLDHLTVAGVDVSGVRLVNDARLGTYFVDLQVPPRATAVVYDRAESAVCSMSPDHVDWETVGQARVVHLTGITPALSPSCMETSLAIAERAPGRVCFDVNYRSKLWGPQEAAESLGPFLEKADTVVCGISDAVLLFDTDPEPQRAMDQLSSRFGIETVVVTAGERGVHWLDGDASGHQSAFPVEIIDRLGAGDALVAGIIDGLLDGDLETGVERGAAMAAVALTTRGDAISLTRGELEALVGAQNGDVDR